MRSGSAQLRAVERQDLLGVAGEGAALQPLDHSRAGIRAEAPSAGFYTSPWGSSHPRLQLLTVGQLLEGKQIDYPHLTGGNVTHRRAPRELKAADQGELGYEAD
jgi:hypothetical protein